MFLIKQNADLNLSRDEVICRKLFGKVYVDYSNKCILSFLNILKKSTFAAKSTNAFPDIGKQFIAKTKTFSMPGRTNLKLSLTGTIVFDLEKRDAELTLIHVCINKVSRREKTHNLSKFIDDFASKIIEQEVLGIKG